MMQPQLFTYTHEEVQVLLDEAQCEGWEEGRKIGYGDGFEDGLEDGKEYLEDVKLQSYREGRDEGYKQATRRNEKVEVQKYEEGKSEGITRGLQAGEHDERQKWLAEGHGHGLCLSMAAHVHELFCGAILLEEAEVQTESATWSNGSTQAAPTTDEMASQTNDEPPHLLNDVGMSKEHPSTCETAIQACDDSQPAPQVYIRYNDPTAIIISPPFPTTTI